MHLKISSVKLLTYGIVSVLESSRQNTGLRSHNSAPSLFLLDKLYGAYWEYSAWYWLCHIGPTTLGQNSSHEIRCTIIGPCALSTLHSLCSGCTVVLVVKVLCGSCSHGALWFLYPRCSIIPARVHVPEMHYNICARCAMVPLPEVQFDPCSQGALWYLWLRCFVIPPEQRSCWGVYWFHSVRLSVRPSVRPSVRLSRLPCPLCNIYSSGWILSILATNDHYHERVCRTQWPLTLTYIFKVIRPWLRKSCSLCSVYSSEWILFIFGTNDHYH